MKGIRYSSTLMVPVKHEVTHVMQRTQASALTGTDFLYLNRLEVLAA
jgi:hypothetical protein